MYMLNCSVGPNTSEESFIQFVLVTVQDLIKKVTLKLHFGGVFWEKSITENYILFQTQTTAYIYCCSLFEKKTWKRVTDLSKEVFL